MHLDGTTSREPPESGSAAVLVPTLASVLQAASLDFAAPRTTGHDDAHRAIRDIVLSSSLVAARPSRRGISLITLKLASVE